MKKLIFMIAFLVSFTLLAAESLPVSPDTTLVVGSKQIRLIEEGNRTKVKVFQLSESGDFEDTEMIFEGHYKDGKSHEKRKHVKNISISFLSWDSDFEGHWAGFGMGFANIADGKLHLNDIDGVSLRSGKSLEYNLNFLEKSFRFSRHRWGVVTGMGIRWNRYRVDGGQFFKEDEDGITKLFKPDDIRMKTSKLNTTSLTIPLLLEWQKRQRNHPQFFVSAGVVAVVKTMSSSKIKYVDQQGTTKKEKVDGGMNLRPITMDFLFQAGFDWIGMYAKYSPVQMFEKDKGPKLHPVSIGLHIHL